MSNTILAEVFKKENLRTGQICFGIYLSDSYGECTLVFAKNDIPEDDLKLLELLIKEQHNMEEHGEHNCTTITEMLENIGYAQSGITIGENFLDWDTIKETLSQDWREVFVCSECGWESFDPDQRDALCTKETSCTGTMVFVRGELFEK